MIVLVAAIFRECHCWQTSFVVLPLSAMKLVRGDRMGKGKPMVALDIMDSHAICIVHGVYTKKILVSVLLE